jgi:hypothetical protein
MFKDKREIPLAYPDNQRKLYFANNFKSVYPFWKRNVGIHKAGRNFPVMVAEKFFKDLGYKVIDQYLLVRQPRKRENNPGYKKLCGIFGEKNVKKVLEESKPILKIQPGGDPDLFVYKRRNKEFFFVEVKENDRLTENQKNLFPIIEKYLAPVYVVRVRSFNSWLTGKSCGVGSTLFTGGIHKKVGPALIADELMGQSCI